MIRLMLVAQICFFFFIGNVIAEQRAIIAAHDATMQTLMSLPISSLGDVAVERKGA